MQYQGQRFSDIQLSVNKIKLVEALAKETDVSKVAARAVDRLIGIFTMTIT